MTETEMEQQTWTCMGRVKLKGGAVGYSWLEANGETRYYSKLKGIPGGIYKVEANETSVRTNTLQYVGQIGDNKLHEEWEASKARFLAAQGPKELRDRRAKERRVETGIAVADAKSHCVCGKPIYDDAAFCVPCGEEANRNWDAEHGYSS